MGLCCFSWGLYCLPSRVNIVFHRGLHWFSLRFTFIPVRGLHCFLPGFTLIQPRFYIPPLHCYRVPEGGSLLKAHTISTMSKPTTTAGVKLSQPDSLKHKRRPSVKGKGLEGGSSCSVCWFILEEIHANYLSYNLAIVYCSYVPKTFKTIITLLNSL